MNKINKDMNANEVRKKKIIEDSKKLGIQTHPGIEPYYMQGALSKTTQEYWKHHPDTAEYYKELHQQKDEAPIGSLSNEEDWFFTMKRTKQGYFRGYKNRFTGEWINEVQYQNRFEDE